MTNDIPTTPLSPEQQNPPKKCKFMPFPDGIRIFALSLFVCAYSLIASFGWISLPFSLEDIFPSLGIHGFFGLGYYICRAITFLILAIPYLTVVFLLVKSFRQMVKFLRIQLIVYGAYIALIVFLFALTGDGFGVILPLFMACGLGAILGVQLLALIIREALREAIQNRKKERIFGWSFLGGTVLLLLIVLVLLPSHSDYGRELNRTLQNPGEIQVVDNYLDNPIVAEIPLDQWDEILSTIKVDTPLTRASEPDYKGDLT
ncbi:MAG: hypothetical protein IKD18_03690, partial [Clostridia bacterium]|nr:hypothetical protein [Clostridia bacterium]